MYKKKEKWWRSSWYISSNEHSMHVLICLQLPSKIRFYLFTRITIPTCILVNLTAFYSRSRRWNRTHRKADGIFQTRPIMFIILYDHLQEWVSYFTSAWILKIVDCIVYQTKLHLLVYQTTTHPSFFFCPYLSEPHISSKVDMPSY